MIRLILPLPPTVNHLWKVSANGGMYKTKVARDYLSQVETAWLEAGQPRITEEAMLGIQSRFFLPDRRRRDLDNLNKALWDSLCACLGIDDSWIYYSAAAKRLDREWPRVEVLIFELPIGSDGWETCRLSHSRYCVLSAGETEDRP